MALVTLTTTVTVVAVAAAVVRVERREIVAGGVAAIE
jgi:hypothetical protein